MWGTYSDKVEPKAQRLAAKAKKNAGARHAERQADA